MKASSALKNYLKKCFTGHHVIVGIIGAFLFASAIIYAGSTLDALNSFTSGTTISSTDVNSNFQTLGSVADMLKHGFACKATMLHSLPTTSPGVSFPCDSKPANHPLGAEATGLPYVIPQDGIYIVDSRMLVMDTVGIITGPMMIDYVYIDGVEKYGDIFHLTSGETLDVKIYYGSTMYESFAPESLVVVKRIF